MYSSIYSYDDYIISEDYLYKIFSNIFLNEQEIEFTEDFTKVLKNINDKNKIAEYLFDILDKNFKLEIEGEIKNVETVDVHPSKPDFFLIHFTKPNGTKAKSEMKVGKFITALVKEIKDRRLMVKPQDIADFVSLIFAERSGNNDNIYEFRLVEGNDILKYYNVKNYECEKGTLGNSCMRSESKQEYIKFYIDNIGSDYVKLLIKVNTITDKITGRALLWKTKNHGFYLDRVYTTDDKVQTEFEVYAKKHFKVKYVFSKYSDDQEDMIVTIEHFKVPIKWPYMDTFKYALYFEEDKYFILSPTSEIIEVPEYLDYDTYFVLEETDGSAVEMINPMKEITLRDGLKYKDIIQEYSWLLEASISDAVIGWNKEGIIWYSGTWHDGNWYYGSWKGGKWEEGTWHNGTWYNGTWYDGTWHDGTWHDGTWHTGTWEKGTWKDGIWKGGTWEYGTWKNGEWEDGIWLYGEWEIGEWKDGEWKDGDWLDGNWRNGDWEDGVWHDGVWDNGTWNGGDWEDGWWHNGVWYNGTWNGGEWKDGKWDDGVWTKGTWENGVWKDGEWLNGVWKDGNWDNGTWENGVWKDGTWENGVWKDGNWDNGIWRDGDWYNGEWENGTWENGVWYNGTWKNGTWKDGEWKDGDWRNGEWEDEDSMTR